MKSMKNELFIGISITVATVAVIVGILFLQQATLFGRGMTVDMTVKNTQGVAEGSEILYRGVHVGTVTGTRISPDEVTLTLRIKEKVAIPEDSSFVIEQQSLLSGSAVQIYPGTSDENLPPGSSVEGEVRGGITRMAEEIGDRAAGLEKEIGSVLESVEELVGEETRSSLIEVLEETRRAAEDFELTFEENRKSLAGTLENLEKVTGESREPLSSSIENVERGTEELVTTLERVQEVSGRLDRVLAELESGEGTAAKMLNEPELYRDLTATMEEMNSLMRDIKENPKKYLSVSIF